MQNFIPAATDYVGMSNVQVVAYRLVRHPQSALATAFFKFKFDAAPILDLHVTLPNGIVAKGFGQNPMIYNEPAGQGIGQAYTMEGWNYIVFRKAPGTNWVQTVQPGTATFIEGQLTFEVDDDGEYDS